MKYLRRGIWYLVTRLLVICLIAGLMITVFYYAYNVSNIRVILKDGLAARAAELLLEQIRRKSDETVLIRIPTRLIIRETAFRQKPRGNARSEKFERKTSARVSK